MTPSRRHRFELDGSISHRGPDRHMTPHPARTAFRALPAVAELLDHASTPLRLLAKFGGPAGSTWTGAPARRNQAGSCPDDA